LFDARIIFIKIKKCNYKKYIMLIRKYL